MNSDNFKIVRYFHYFQNETGKSTQSVDTARSWIDKGRIVRAVLSDGDDEEKFKTAAIKHINVSDLEYKMTFVTEDKEKYFIKLKFPKEKYIRLAYFFVDKDIPENRIPKNVEGKKAKGIDDILNDVKKLVDRCKDVHAVYYDECKVTTSRIVKINPDEKYFTNDVGIKYYMD